VQRYREKAEENGDCMNHIEMSNYPFYKPGKVVRPGLFIASQKVIHKKDRSFRNGLSLKLLC
jgi:hypothetical protein